MPVGPSIAESEENSSKSLDEGALLGKLRRLKRSKYAVILDN